MILFDYFDDIIAQVLEKKVNDFSGIDYASFNSAIEQAIQNINEKTSTLNSSQVNMAKYAVYCWIDEVVARSNWDAKSQWQQNSLQERYFDSANGGETFFTNIANFTNSDAEVVRVYYRCLAFGFRGKYFRAEDNLELQKIKKHCLELMSITPSTNNGTKHIFQSLYDSLNEKPIVTANQPKIKWYKSTVMQWLWPVGLLILVFLFFYAVLYFTVHNYFALLS